ncbi:MAG: universal stress protein [Candidatus Bathyarchaeia archaeon]
MITKILVGVDGSENSEKALDRALEIADKFSASVLILNVFQLPPEFEYNFSMFQQSKRLDRLKRQWAITRLLMNLKKCMRKFCLLQSKEQLS